MRFALHVPNFRLPDELVEMGVRAEASGWDGFLLWDHVFGDPHFAVPMADPWTVLGALAVQTERIRLGTAITPAARRRPQKLARETVTVDHLSNGRLILGVGLGAPPAEYEAFGDSADPRTLAARLDEALSVITGLWSGEPFELDGEHFTVRGAQFLPPPVQQPRIPIWAACTTPHPTPLRRAARWDGLILATMTPDGRAAPVPADELREAAGMIAEARGSREGFEIALVHPSIPDPDELETYSALGATWMLVTGWGDELLALAARPPAAGTSP